ncbi:Protein of unknown function [Bacillus wiedmannii]|nr:Protein of unknown function [Bacillus wiedmannii]
MVWPLFCEEMLVGIQAGRVE